MIGFRHQSVQATRMKKHPDLPTPMEMTAHLNRYVQGQERAKRDVAVAIYNHYLSQTYRDMHGWGLGHHHILMLGPTGTGKTYLVRTLAEFLDVPLGFTSATNLVEVGYKGDSVESVVANLLNRAGGDPRKAERGIIFIDEIDKIRRQDTGGTRDVSGEGVQNALLTLMDGRSSNGTEGYQHQEVDTSRLLFICTGAFVGLDKQVRERLDRNRSHIGFRLHESETEDTLSDDSVYTALRRTETRDLIEFGLIPEFIGRFTTLTALHELDQAALVAILTETRHSALKRQQALVALHGIDLQFDRDALDAIAREAASLGTGARGLQRLVCRVVDPIDYQLPELADQGITRITITRECVENEAEPRMESSPAAGQPPREDQQLRQQALRGLPRRPRPVQPTEEGHPLPKGISDVSSWTDEKIWNNLEVLKQDKLKWKESSPAATFWWNEFEKENRHRPALVFRLAEELAVRKASINELFLSYSHSGTDNIQANLHFLDYRRLKRKHGAGEDDSPAEPEG